MQRLDADYWLHIASHIRVKAITHIGAERWYWFCEEFSKIDSFRKGIRHNSTPLDLLTEYNVLNDAELNGRLSAIYLQRVGHLMTLPNGYQAYAYWTEIRQFKEQAFHYQLNDISAAEANFGHHN